MRFFVPYCHNMFMFCCFTSIAYIMCIETACSFVHLINKYRCLKNDGRVPHLINSVFLQAYWYYN